MKLARILLLTASVLSVHHLAAQTRDIVGSWQLIRQSTCLEEMAGSDDLRDDMRAHSSATPKLVTFKANSKGQESTRILNYSRVANPKKFYYKFNGNLLLILDKKSQTISDSYVVDKITPDSLILSSSSRPCEVRVFSKISESR